MYLLDTNVVSDLIRNPQGRVTAILKLCFFGSYPGIFSF